MLVYQVELDGVSMIVSGEELQKGDLLRLNAVGEVNFYKVRSVEESTVGLRLVKTLEPEEDGVTYKYDGKEYKFETRLSKNQIVNINGEPYKVNGIEKKTNKLDLEYQVHKKSLALYGVYASRVDEGLTSRDRETGDYTAEKYFTEWGKAIGYVVEERSKGRKLSL